MSESFTDAPARKLAFKLPLRLPDIARTLFNGETSQWNS